MCVLATEALMGPLQRREELAVSTASSHLAGDGPCLYNEAKCPGVLYLGDLPSPAKLGPMTKWFTCSVSLHDGENRKLWC